MTIRSRSAFGDAAQLEAQRHVLGDRAPGQERELLEHHRHPVHAQAAQGLRVAARHIDGAAVIVDLTEPRITLFSRSRPAAGSTCPSRRGP